MQQKIGKFKKLKEQCIEILMDCHERQILRQPPRLVTETQYVGKLINNNFITLRFYTTENGKTVMSLFITQNGINYLNEINE